MDRRRLARAGAAGRPAATYTRGVRERLRADLPTWIARALSATLVLVVLARALTLGGEYYDAYETRLAARTLLGQDTGQPFPVYRSPLMVLASVLFEALGRGPGWVGPALLSAAAYAGLIAGVERLCRRLGVRPWAAAAAGLLCALDLAAWGYASHGLPDLPAACACALVLAAAARPGPWAARPLALGLLVGLAGLARHNVGVVGLALLAGVPLTGVNARADGADGAAEPTARVLGRVALAGVVAVALYLVVSTLVFAWAGGSLSQGLAGHGALLEFQRLQLAENRQRLGALQPALVALRFVVTGAPWLLLLAPVGAWRALRAGAPARACLAWAAAHLLLLSAFAGHVEARYVLPALPALAALAALALDALPRDAGRRGLVGAAAAVLLVAAVPLALRGPFAARHALDATTRRSAPAAVAAGIEEAVRAGGAPGARVFWTTTHPYPVAPRVVMTAPGTPFVSDPFHGIYHLGPVVLAYHLERPVVMLPPPPGHEGGARALEALRGVVRGARLPDGAPAFRPGDLLVVGTPFPGRTWDLLAHEGDWPPLLLAPVVGAPGALDVDPRPALPATW